jgi:hypothetical protein
MRAEVAGWALTDHAVLVATLTAAGLLLSLAERFDPESVDTAARDRGECRRHLAWFGVTS